MISADRCCELTFELRDFGTGGHPAGREDTRDGDARILGDDTRGEWDALLGEIRLGYRTHFDLLFLPAKGCAIFLIRARRRLDGRYVTTPSNSCPCASSVLATQTKSCRLMTSGATSTRPVAPD